MRGTTFLDTWSLGPNIKNISPTLDPIAKLVLERHEVPQDGSIVGDILKGYDIKAQDSVTVLRLSILAQALKSSTDIASMYGILPEVYCNSNGIATLVTGKSSPSLDNMTLLYTSESRDYPTRVDHVLVKGQDPLPTRYTKGAINLMGNGIATAFSTVCTAMSPIKNETLRSEAWAEFETSPQSERIQKLLRDAVKRSEWEQLVGYKVRFAQIPPYASLSLSQTTPRQHTAIATNAGIEIPIQFTTNEDDGGIVDIGGVSILGAQILDIVNGIDLFNSYGAYLTDPAISPDYKFTENDYYILLDYKCSLLGLGRGETWFLIPGSDPVAGSIKIRPSSADWVTWKALNGGVEITQHFFRRFNGYITSIGDVIKKDISEGNTPLGGGESTNAMLRGNILVGYGGDKGIEAEAIIVSYTVAKPSIQIRSTRGDAPDIAASVARGGVTNTPIVIKDIPAPTGYYGSLNGNCTLGERTCLRGGGDSSGAFYPPAPLDEESEELVDVDSPLDELEGSVIDITAPFLGAKEVMNLAQNIHTLVNSNTAGYSRSYSYAGVGYNILPGMRFRSDDEIVHTVEILYNDKDSITTNITTGPKYYPMGSYQDSQYVKRSETLTRNGRVINGSNEEGTFIVHVDGRGNFEAISQILEPIFPGDKVEVKLLNIPAEKD